MNKQLTVLRVHESYMPQWSSVSQWCRSLGRMGSGRYGEWLPRFSIYNDGTSNPLYFVKGWSPFFVLHENSPWELLRIEHEKLLPQGNPGYVIASNLNHIGVHFDLRDSTGVAFLRIKYGASYFAKLPAKHIFHLVQTKTILKTFVEYRPLPLIFIPQSVDVAVSQKQQ